MTHACACLTGVDHLLSIFVGIRTLMANSEEFYRFHSVLSENNEPLYEEGTGKPLLLDKRGNFGHATV